MELCGGGPQGSRGQEALPKFRNLRKYFFFRYCLKPKFFQSSKYIFLPQKLKTKITDKKMYQISIFHYHESKSGLILLYCYLVVVLKFYNNKNKINVKRIKICIKF